MTHGLVTELRICGLNSIENPINTLTTDGRTDDIKGARGESVLHVARVAFMSILPAVDDKEVTRSVRI